MTSSPLRVGIGGPVGSGKTALTLLLCKSLRDRYDIAAVTNDIYTEEDAQFQCATRRWHRAHRRRDGRLPPAIREDASSTSGRRAARAIPALRIVFGGDNLAATFSPTSDLTLYVIDVAAATRSAQGRPGHHEVGPAHHQ